MTATMTLPLSQPTLSALLDRFTRKTATVGVVGLGYVGLPLVRAFLAAGFRTIGFDSDPEKVATLRDYQCYIAHLGGEWIRESLENNQFDPTTDMLRLCEPDAVVLCVPTPLTASRDPDLQYVRQTTAAVARTLRRGQLVILESTTYPGTTRDVMLPMLAESGLTVGTDFFLAYSPEREDPGNASFSTERIPKVVGGYDEASRAAATALYQQVIEQVVPVSSCEVAEATKILENTYRLVNIAMVNEMKLLLAAMGIDIWEVIEAAKTKPFGFQAFYPGPGLGGHCIPIDPFYLSWCARNAGLTTRFIELAGEVNRAMPQHVVSTLISTLNTAKKPLHGSRILILGAAYKKNIDDPRESPAFEIISELLSGGAVVDYNDPHLARLPKMRSWSHLPPMESVTLSPASLATYDAAIIVTDHTAYDYTQIVQHSQLVIDTRNATAHVEPALCENKVVKC